MNERVIIPLGGIGTLVLERQAFDAALAAGQSLYPLRAAKWEAAIGEPLLDSEQVGAQLSIPAKWIEQAAREGRIPALVSGRYRRFKRSEVEETIRAARGADPRARHKQS
jgi:excisionase family DNA binding protein